MSSSLDSRSIWVKVACQCADLGTRGEETYVLDGDRLAGGLLDALVDDAKAAPCVRRVRVGRSERRRTGRLTTQLLQDLIVLCNALGSHCA